MPSERSRKPKFRIEWTNGTVFECLADREIPAWWDDAMDAIFAIYSASNRPVTEAPTDAK